MRPCEVLRLSTAAPENPFKILPSQAYVELKSAYCVAVYPRFVRLDIYVTRATPAKLMLKLSPAMTAAKRGILIPANARDANAAIAAACKIPPMTRVRM